MFKKRVALEYCVLQYPVLTYVVYIREKIFFAT